MIPVFVEWVPGPWWRPRWRCTVQLTSIGRAAAVTSWHWTHAGAERAGRRRWVRENARSAA